MAKVLLLETKKDSPISNILHSLGHSIIRIDLEEGEKKALGPSKNVFVPDIILWDENIKYSPLKYFSSDLTEEAEAQIAQIVILKSYNKRFLRSWMGGSHYGFLLRPVSEPAVVSVVENALTQLHSRSNSLNFLEKHPESYLVQYEEAALAKSQFIANMSHELRTPLNIILGYSELLAQEETEPSKQEKLSSVQRAGKNLLAMVNDILDFSRIEADRLELKHELFSLRDLITYQPSFFNQQLSSKQIKLETDLSEDMPYWFYGDPHRMHQIVTNLLSNAIKFTPAGKITLSCSYIEEKVVIEVVDTGIGIAPDRYGKLFTPFEQVEGAPNRSYSGTGLGLAIVKSLVEKMDGGIEVESTLGEGSKFTVSLPLQPSSTNLAQEKAQHIDSAKQLQNSPPPPAEGKLHILLAEDNRVNQQLMRLILKNFGHTCDTAPEGKTALKYLQSQNYDLAIVDMHMPVMDGYQLVKEIRKDPKLQGLPVFSLSAATSRAETDEFLRIGCNDYLHKPVDTQELQKKINQLINRENLNKINPQ